MARIKHASNEVMRLPTFATLDASPMWDDEKNEPSPQTANDMICDEHRLDFVKPWLTDFNAWRSIQADAAEASARAAYVEHVARHLVGIFPNARIAPDAYAAAMVEELIGFSADVVKLAAQRARRTCKTLPSIAHMVEACEAEAKRRHVIASTLRRALIDYEAAIAKGEAEAEAIATKITTAVPSLTASTVLAVFRGLTGTPLGFALENQRGREARAAILGALRLAEQGDSEAAQILEAAASEIRALSERVISADDDTWLAAHTAHREAVDRFRAVLRRACRETPPASTAGPPSGHSVAPPLQGGRPGQPHEVWSRHRAVCR